MAYDEDPSNSNVQRVLQQGYQVDMRLRSLQLDVKIEIRQALPQTSRRHQNDIARDDRGSRGGSTSLCELPDSQTNDTVRHEREIRERDPCGDVWPKVGDVQRG